MTEPLHTLLLSSLPSTLTSTLPPFSDPATTAYLSRLSTLTTTALTSTEPETLSYASRSILDSLHALTTRSFRAVDTAVESLDDLKGTLPALSANSGELGHAIPGLESAAQNFAAKYGRGVGTAATGTSGGAENTLLERRRRIMRLSDNVERVSDILELPSLLASTIAASAAASSTSSTTTTSGSTLPPLTPLTTTLPSFPSTTTTSIMTSASQNTLQTTALDIHAHIRRLARLYPTSPLIASIATQADDAMQGLTANLVAALRAPGLKLAGAMRLVGLLRRVAPELDEATTATSGSLGRSVGTGGTGFSSSLTAMSTTGAAAVGEGSLGLLFLICRLSNLLTTLEALEPLRDLADQETSQRLSQKVQHQQQQNTAGGTGATAKSAWSAGQQTERYLKRYIELFREGAFSIISMYKSIFPSSLAGPSTTNTTASTSSANLSTTVPKQMEELPPALAPFTLHILDTLLVSALKIYLPNIQDKSSRDSLLTQVLYCASSFGRLGADFGLLIADLGNLDEDDESDRDGDQGEIDEVEGNGAGYGGRREGNGEEEDEGGFMEDPEWVQVMKRHRIAAGRLELLAGGVGVGGVDRRGSSLLSPLS